MHGLNDNLKPDEAVPTLLKEKGRAADAKAARAAGAKGGGGGGKPGDRRRKARIVTVGAGASCGAGRQMPSSTDPLGSSR